MNLDTMFIIYLWIVIPAFILLCIAGGWLILTEIGCFLSFKRRVNDHIEEIEKGNYEDEIPKCEHIF